MSKYIQGWTKHDVSEYFSQEIKDRVSPFTGSPKLNATLTLTQVSLFDLAQLFNQEKEDCDSNH